MSTTIETIDRYPELYTGLELCDGCRRRFATNVVTERDGVSVTWRFICCPVCAERHDPEAINRPAPRPVYDPQIVNPRRGFYQVQSETNPSQFYNVFASGPKPMCTCPGRFHANCKHRKAVAPLWAATLAVEAAQVAPEVEREAFDDGWTSAA
jgi:hypothetical protein